MVCILRGVRSLFVCLESKKRCRLRVCSGVLDRLCSRAMAWHTGYA